MNPQSLADRRAFITSVVLIIILVFISGGMGAYVLSDPGIKDAFILAKSIQTIQEAYIDEISTPELIESARQGMFDSLDRYSFYVNSNDFERMEEELTGEYAGIGITITRHDQGLLIMSVREDGPSYKVGLIPGDIIIKADSVSLAGLSTSESSNILRGDEGTDVLVSIFQPLTEDTIEVTITREKMSLIHVPFAGITSDSALYIRLWDFDAGASDQVQAAIDSLLINSKIKPNGLILDLRGNPGGLFREAYEVANLFLKEGEFIVGTDARSLWNEIEIYADGKDITDNLPMAIMVDRGSASSSEIVAGALQQAGRAFLVGDTTFGKGLVQGYVSFPGGDGLRLTISRYYFDNNIFLNEFDSALIDTGTGLIPDYYYHQIRRNDFIRALESSLLLQWFVNDNYNEIINTSYEQLQSDMWMNRLEDFLQQKKFDYLSGSTAEIERIRADADQEQYSKRTRAVLDKFISKSVKIDNDLLSKMSGYISLRIMQIAWQREYGTFRSYSDVTIKYSEDIKYASQLLRKRD